MVIKWNIGKDREALGFAQAVKRSFDFLELEYGYRLVDEKVTFLKYESDRMYVNVFHGRGSYELGVEISRRGASDNFGLTEVLHRAKVLPEDQSYSYMSSNKEDIPRLVKDLAEKTRTYAIELLQGDEKAIKEVYEIRSKVANRESVRRLYANDRIQAQQAWEGKKYVLAYRYYKRIAADALTKLEKKRIAYIEKKFPKETLDENHKNH